MKSERFEMRIDEELSNRVKLWSDTQLDTPTKSKSIRRLIELGLSVAQPDEIHPTTTEKLLLVMLCDILKKMDSNAEIDPDFLLTVISRGHYWALNERFSILFNERLDTPSDVQTVNDILKMWDFIERSFEKMSPNEITDFEKSTKLNKIDFKFKGFDGNEEGEYFAIAEIIVHELNRFRRFKNHEAGLNSHTRVLSEYLRMYKIFKPIYENAKRRGKLNNNELAQILNA